MDVVKAQALRNLTEVVRHGIYSGYRVSQPEGGVWVQKLEAAIATSYGARAMACSSGSAALYLALRAAGVGFGDRVLVPAMTMSATASAVVMCGATPVWVDCHPSNGLVTLEQIIDAHAACLEEWGQPPVALILVHLHGVCYNTSQYNAALPNLRIIEDCCQAPACTEPNSPTLVGTGGLAAAFSLKQGKVVTCGEGGFVMTPHEDIATGVRLYRNHGEMKHQEVLGFNWHMSELQAAVALAEWGQLRLRQATRLEWARLLDMELAAITPLVYHPMAVINPPFIYYVVAEDIRAPSPQGFRRGYHQPLCCIPWYKAHLKEQGCALNAHTFMQRMHWIYPPESQLEVDHIVAAVRKASKCA